MIANIITLSRIVFSGLLLLVKPFSNTFTVLYLLCGATDILDGFIARILHTESEHGAVLDSMADLFFAVIYAVRILPVLHIPVWLLVWTAIIAAVKITGIIITSKKTHKLFFEHSFGNKLTGFLVFLLPLSVHIVDVKYGATVVCAVASYTAVKEIINIKGKNYD